MNSTRLKLVLIVLVFSLVLNLGLASLLRARRASAPGPAAPEESEEPATVDPTPRRLTPSRARAVVDTSVPVETFQWNAVESPDYKVYIANLRRIGCPEETIRDLIVADLNKGYLARMNAVAAQGRAVAYWKSDSGRSEQLRALEKELREIEREKRSVVKELLGVDVPETGTVEAGKLLRDELTYGFLPPDKAGQVRTLFQHYAELEREIGERSGGWPTAEDRAARRDLQTKRDAELAALLSPSELDEYKMRNSPTADNVRTKTVGMDLSENDFRKLYGIRKTYEEALAQLDPQAKTGQPREQLRQQRDDQVKNLLGDQRYTQYQRSQDFDYQNLASLGERYKLPAETVNSAYEINRTAQEQMNQLFNDRSLDSTRRKEAIAAIRAETEQELKRTLGQAGYDAFQERGSGVTVSGNGGGLMMRSVSFGPGGNNVIERRVSTDPSTPASSPVRR